jgi:Uma2 family endonuclease
MPTVVARPPGAWTAVDVAERFGPIPIERLRLGANNGHSATERDVLAIYQVEKRMFELVDGLLVEKVMGFRESCIAMVLIQALRNYLAGRNLGTVAGEAGMMRLAPNLIRIPDVSYIAWDRLPNRQIPVDPLPQLAPNLAVEVLSPSNTEQELRRKLFDYFEASVELVWFVDLDARTVKVFTAPERWTLLGGDQTLEGGSVLPGFNLPLKNLFSELDAR